MISTDQEIQKCLHVLTNGGTLLYPTDTIWGIGCDATNPEAVEIVYRLKNREEHKSLIILLDSPEKIRDYVTVVPERAWELIKNATTPLTIIYPQAKNLAANVVADDNSVAIRIVKNEFCRRLISEFGKPIVSTSANISGQYPPLKFKNISSEIINGVDHVVDESFDLPHPGKTSRLIKLNPDGTFRVIRH